MCLVALSFQAHRLVILANRDEYHSRPTAFAHWWEQGILAGRDLVANGTWLGITRGGRFALVTNYREAGVQRPDAASRGALIKEFLTNPLQTKPAISDLQRSLPAYNGCNIIAGDLRQLFYASNRVAELRQLDPGIYGLSNHLLDTPWPKVTRTTLRLKECLTEQELDLNRLWQMLADVRGADDHELPSTGISLEWERKLASPFIVSEHYGTRCSTIVLVDQYRHAQFHERSFAPNGQCINEVSYTFKFDAS